MGGAKGNEGRTALVTGANRGLGLATCRVLARRGYRVILTARRQQDAAAAAQEVGGDAEGVSLDVTDDSSVLAVRERLQAAERWLDVLVNNAGISLEGFDGEVANRTLQVNLFGAVRVADQLLPRIRDGGNVVMVSSSLGELSSVSEELRDRLLSPQLSRDELFSLMHDFLHHVHNGTHEQRGWPSNAYRVSKVGLNAYTRVLAREVKPRGIRVNAVCPGWVRTRMGGSHATRSPEQGAASVVWAATLDEAQTGGFFRDGARLDW